MKKTSLIPFLVFFIACTFAVPAQKVSAEQNKDIKVLLSEDGTPVLNERGKPILTNKDEKPLNSDDMNDIEIKIAAAQRSLI